MLKEAGEPPGVIRPRPVGHLSHGLTHFQLELDCVLLPISRAAAGPDPEKGDVRWATLAEIQTLPLARLCHKALALLELHRVRIAHGEEPRGLV